MKKMKFIFNIFFTILLLTTQWMTAQEITIQWADHMKGDFSFKDNWSYPEGVYLNQFGQLSCDGLCPPEVDDMKDDNGKIKAEMLPAFYLLVDTTRQYHSILSEAWVYEWAGTDFIQANRISGDTVICSTLNNAATHSSLQLIITENTVKPSIVLTSIKADESGIFTCIDGSIIINRFLWEQGIIQATFHFMFDEVMNDGQQMWWKGLIYAKVDTINNDH